MYALLSKQDELVNGKPLAIYRKSKAVTIGNFNFPHNWMRRLTDNQKQGFNIWPVVIATYDKTTMQPTGEDYTYIFDGSKITETTPVIFDPELVVKALETMKKRALQQIRDEYEQDQKTPVVVAPYGTFTGGEASAGAINATIGLGQIAGETDVVLTDIDDEEGTYTQAEAVAIVAAVGLEARRLFFWKQKQKRQIRRAICCYDLQAVICREEEA